MKEPILEMPFAAGIDQSQRFEIMDPRAGFVMLENVRAPTRGAVVKRQGYDAHTGTDRIGATTRIAGRRMFDHYGKTCVTDGTYLDAYTPGEETQIVRGRVPECGLSMMKIPAPPGKGEDLGFNQGEFVVTDSVIVGAYLVIAYVAGISVYASVVEASTGLVISPPTLIASRPAGTTSEIYGLLGKYASTAVLVIGGDASNGDIRISYLECSDAATIAAGWSVAAADSSDNAGSALSVQSHSSYIFYAYVNDSAGASQVSVKTFNSTGSGLTGATINTSSVTPDCVAIDSQTSGAGTLWVAWNESTAVKVKGLSSADLTITNATTATVITTTAPPTAPGAIEIVTGSLVTTGRLFVNDDGKSHWRTFTTVTGAVSPSGSTATQYNVMRKAKPFRIGSRYYAPCDSTAGGSFVLCDLTESDPWVRPVANVAPILVQQGAWTAKPAAYSASEFWYPVGIRTTGTVIGAQVAKFDFAAPYRWRPASHNGVTFLSGGLVSFFDGVRVAESGFVVRPPAVTAVDSGGGSGLTGIYGYVVVYEQVDSAGNWHVSGVSEPGFSGSITDNTMTVTVRPLGISARISAATDPSVRISIFRTVGGGEPPYYFVTSLTNTLTAATQTYTDTTPDDSLISARQLYAPNLPGVDGSSQDRRAPRGMDHLCSYNGMLVGAADETLYWSFQDIGGEGTSWNEVFQQPVPGGGAVTALECQDGTLFAWKRDRIFAAAGQPSVDNGTDGGLGTPTRLATDVGARLPFTCATSLGIFFVSDRGIELLNRSRQVEFIGEGVQDTFDAFPYVTSMTYDPNSSCVIIESASGYSAGATTGTGRTFVFDTRTRVWRSIDRRTVSATADIPAQDGGMLWDGAEYRYAWLRSDGQTYIESAEHSLDPPGDARVRMYAKTSSIHLGGIQGEQMIEGVLLLGEHLDDHDLEIGIANDYVDAFVSQSMDSDQLAEMALYNPHFDIEQQTGQAIQVELEDAAPTGDANDEQDGAAAKWVALTFIGAAKSGAKRTSTVLRGGTE